MMGKIIINVHSFIDVITNSSTTTFCYVKDKTVEQVKEIVDSIVEEFDCDAVDFYVEEADWYWDEEKDKEVPGDGRIEVGWQYETAHEPCGMMMKKLKELFGGCVDDS